MAPVLSQMAKLTAAETHRLDRVFVAISVSPELGSPVPDTLLRDYIDDVDGFRVIYYVTALRQISIVAYVEACLPSTAAASGPCDGPDAATSCSMAEEWLVRLGDTVS